MNSTSVVISGACERHLAGGDLGPQEAAKSTPRDPDQSLLRTLILIALYAIPAAVVMRSINDNDIWMNIRAGQWIVAHGAVPAHRPVLELWPGEAVGGL